MTINRQSLQTRRRRVLTQEHSQTTANTPAALAGNESSTVSNTVRPKYTPAARLDVQPHVWQLVPLRPWTLLLWYLIAATGMTGLVALHCVASERLPASMQQTWMFLDHAYGISRCLNSWALLLGAVLAWIILQLRRQRINDYRARYRIWYYVLVSLTLAAIHASTGLLDTLQLTANATISAIGIPLPDWFGTTFLLAVATGTWARMCSEFRDCRVALITSTVTLLLILFHISSVWLPDSTTSLVRTILVSGSSLFGQWCVILTLAAFARYVVQDVGSSESAAEIRTRKANTALWQIGFQWLSWVRRQHHPAKQAESADVTTTADRADQRRAEQRQEVNKKVARARKAAGSDDAQAVEPSSSQPVQPDRSSEANACSTIDQTDEATVAKLSKAERRRLRKQKRRQSAA